MVDKNHRTTVELVRNKSLKVNRKQHECFEFRFLDEQGQPVEHAMGYAVATHFVVISEGNRAAFFYQKDVEASEREENEANFVEPTIKWRKSEAKKLLRKAIFDGNVSADATGRAGELQEIYHLHPEFADYDFGKFAARLARVREEFKNNEDRAAEDLAAFENYISYHEVSLVSRKGYIQWQGCDAQRLLLKDIENNLHTETKPKELWDSRPEYRNEFPLKVFRSKLEQEVRTAKYLHTVKMKGVQYKAS
jgi:hypothetical protein